tara:strand:- start:293 stop:1231 length:939 start_codon:yes stop_codon:yes gene_type:complete
MKKKNLLILGGTGMVGSSVLRRSNKSKYNVYSPNRKQLDLFILSSVKKYFKKINPDIVVMCAARVGGIYANSTFKADFINENLLIQNNIITSAHDLKIKKLIFLGSSCIYPRDTKQPIKEEYLLSGKLEKTNESYAIAKIAGIKMIQAYSDQYKDNFISLMPTNIYGINDNFHPKNSHVVPALILKIYDAYINKKKIVSLWGSGKPLRDLLYVDDLADAILFLAKKYNSPEIINIGSGREVSINQLAKLISKIIGYKGKIFFDKSYPDGTPRKILDITKIKKKGWKPKTNLKEGLRKTIQWYIYNYNNVKRN